MVLDVFSAFPGEGDWEGTEISSVYDKRKGCCYVAGDSINVSAVASVQSKMK